MSTVDGMTLPERVLESTIIADIGLRKAAADKKAADEKQAAVNKVIPRVVDAMVEHERIRPDQREKLAEELRDPVRALELMIKVAGHRNAAEAAKLGEGVPTGRDKSASHQVRSAPYVGANNPGVPESTAKFFSGLGLPVPTE